MQSNLLKLLVLIAIVLAAGCETNNKVATNQPPIRTDTPQGMIQHLQKKRLPALKAVQVWKNEYGPGLKITTDHYIVYTTLLEPLMLSDVPGFLESAYRDYNRQLPKPIETKNHFVVYLFATRKQWDDFTDVFAGENAHIYRKIKVGAYALKGACVAYNIGRNRTFRVIGHEGWHQFNKRHFKFRLPSWLDEGAAMLFETSRYENGFFYFEPAKNIPRLASLKKTLVTNQMIPLSQLIAMNPGEILISDNDSAVGAFYSQSYALVRFLREEGYGKRLRRYHNLMLDGLHGNWPLNDIGRKMASDRNIPITVSWNKAVGSMLFRQYITEDISEIEKEYLNFCKKMVYHIRLKVELKVND